MEVDTNKVEACLQWVKNSFDENNDEKSGSESPSYTGSRFPTDGPDFSNEISAPYEVPQFPIEQIEKKLAIQRQITVKVLEDKRSHYEPSLVGVVDEQDHLGMEEHDFVPHFQRVSISGEDTSGVSTKNIQYTKSYSIAI
ncbi:hypothetical protein QE152_g22437 [Popillia japonica]|uniref:Uncharacterized protein n=1 Tax=Popillia japonica TaxID=7064 RepID=A0AAW1KKC1_POPJA